MKALLNYALLALCAATPSLLSANCTSVRSGLYIKHANATLEPLTPVYEGHVAGPINTELSRYSVRYLGQGDTLLIYVWSQCGSAVPVSHDGVVLSSSPTVQDPPLPGDGLAVKYKTAAPGTYTGGDYEDIYLAFEITIAPMPTVQGLISVDAWIFLDGARSKNDDMDPDMRTDLQAAGLLPMTEPYTGMGYTFTGGGGGGGTISATAAAMPLVDWVIVELRSAAQPSTVLASKAALLLKTGRIVDTDGNTPSFDLPPGNYHVAFKHRNHLGVMTQAPLTFGIAPAVVSMRASSGNVYGTGALHDKNYGGWSMWCGNTRNTPGTQQLKYTGADNDRDPILVRIGGTVPTATVTGYYVEDVNLDGVVKYTGLYNDRDLILLGTGSTTPTTVRTEQLP